MPHSLIISPQIHRMYKYMTVRVKCIEKKIYVHVFHILHQQIHVFPQQGRDFTYFSKIRG